MEYARWRHAWDSVKVLKRVIRNRNRCHTPIAGNRCRASGSGFFAYVLDVRIYGAIIDVALIFVCMG
jgi:hypothetical protein